MLDQAAGEVVLLEAMEAATPATPPLVSIGSKSPAGASGIAVPQRLLAGEPDRDCAIRAEQSLVRGTRSSGHGSHLESSALWGKGPSLIGIALYNAMAAIGVQKKPRSHPAWTESKPYAGWCGTRELITPRDPISLGFSVDVHSSFSSLALRSINFRR